MHLNRYLIIGKRRNQKPTARLSANAPALDSHEIAVKVSMELPDEIFSKPQLYASIKVPSSSVSAPAIDAEVIDNIQETIAKTLGIDLNIALIESHV